MRPTDPENAATDFTPESMTAPSPELERVLEGAGQLEERNQLFGHQSIPKLSPSENLLESGENSSQKLAVVKIADTKKSQQNQERIVEPLDDWTQDELEAEGVFSPEELAANQAKLSQMIAKGFNSIPAEPKPKCKSGYRIVDGQVEVIPATITKEDRQQAQEMLAKKASKNNTSQSDQSDEEKQIEGFQKLKNAIAAIKSRTPMAKSRKHWADKIAESAKKAESFLTNQQYQINTNGYFIDEKGEF